MSVIISKNTMKKIGYRAWLRNMLEARVFKVTITKILIGRKSRAYLLNKRMEQFDI